MTDTETYMTNVERWARAFPKEALMLPYAKTEGMHACLTEVGEENCYRLIDGERWYLHEQHGAEKEAADWFSSLKLKDIEVLYVYGVGLGYYYEALLPWLKSDPVRAVVFIEDDLAVINALFHTERANDLLKDRQVHLLYIPQGDAKSELLDEVYWNFVLTKATVSSLHSYRKYKREIYDKLCHEVSYSGDLKKALLDEYLNFGAPYYANCYRNLLRLPECYLGDKLFHQFKGVPAIICGAGPSLEKNCHLLQQVANRALIFAGGSSINILNRMYIQPDFCVGIDPNVAQQVRLKSNQAFEVPYFYRHRLNYNAFCTLHAPRLYVTGSGGYDISEFLEDRLGIQGTFFEEGHNVINFAMELAHQMGCDPIIFMGMDLAFTDQKTYSQGVTFDPAVEQKTLDEYANFETTGLKHVDIYGKPIYTLWKWLAESEWIGSWASKHSDLRIYNCTEGGIGFPGVQNRPIDEVASEYFGQSQDLLGKIHCEIQSSHMPQVTLERVIAVMKELRESVSNSQKDLDLLINELETVKKETAEEQHSLPYAQSGRAAMLELDLAEEPAWAAVLDIFNMVAGRILNKELMMINRDPNLLEWQRSIKRMELTQKRLAILRNAAKANGELIDFAFSEREAELALQEQAGEPEAEVMSLPAHRPHTKPIKFIPPSEIREGAWKEHYPSGALKCETHYHHGKLHGKSQFFAEDGQLLADSTFKNDERVGEALFYYPNGAVYSRLNYENGLLQGPQRYYYEDGKDRTILEYAQGMLVGEALLYNPEGKLLRHIIFKAEIQQDRPN